MHANVKLRAGAVCAFLVAAFTVYAYRLVQLQVVRREEFAPQGAQAHVFKQNIPAQRGNIVDARGETLAGDVPMRKVIVDGTHLSKPIPVAGLLAKPLGMTPKELLEKFDPTRRYFVLKRQVPEAVAEEIQKGLAAQGLRGIYFEPDSHRVYPNGALLCHLLGFTGFQNAEQREEHGIQGIELSMDRYLTGQAGYRYIERDRTGAELVQHRGIEQSPRNGHTVRLTVDTALQSIVEEELDKAVKQYAPEKAIAIMMRPKTGEILAMANRPNFNLNERNEAEPEEMKNRAIIDMIEPGSTFKIVTVSGALNERLVRPDTKLYCENGRWEYNKNLLRDAHAFGELSVHDVLVHSSNIGAAKLGVQLGATRLHRLIRSFGFGERTGIDLPGEIEGLLHPVSRWSAISVTHIPMGHEVGVTPLQIVMAMGAIANGGKLMAPKVVQSILDEKGQPIADFPPVTVRQVVNAETVRQVTAALEDVVGPHGTAKGAAVPGFRVAGKTGTAQKPGPHGYIPGKYVVSFVGFMPVEDPEFVCMVMLDSAHTKPNENYGGLVSAPVFANIAARAARYLSLEPRETPLLVGNNGGGKPGGAGNTAALTKQNVKTARPVPPATDSDDD